LNITTSIETYENIVIVDIKWINNKINAFWKYFIEDKKPYFKVFITREIALEAVYSNFQQCTMYNSDMDNSFIINYQGQLELTMGNYYGEKKYVLPSRDGGYFSPFTAQHSLWTVFDYGSPKYFPTIAWSDNETNIHAGVIATYTSPNQRETVSYHGGSSTKKHPGFAEAQLNWFGKSDSESLHLRQGTKFSMELYFYQNVGSIDSLWNFNENLLSQNFDYILPENYVAASWGARTSPLEHYYWRFPQVSSNYITSQELWRHKGFAIPRSQNGIWNIHLFSLNLINSNNGQETELTPIYGTTPLFDNLWIDRDDSSYTGGMSWQVDNFNTKLFFKGYPDKHHVTVSGEVQNTASNTGENYLQFSTSPRTNELYIDNEKFLFSFVALDSVLDTVSIGMTHFSGTDSFFLTNNKTLNIRLEKNFDNFTQFQFDLYPITGKAFRRISQIADIENKPVKPFKNYFINTTGNSGISFLPSSDYHLFNDQKQDNDISFDLFAAHSFDSLKISFKENSHYIADIQTKSQAISDVRLVPYNDNNFIINFPFKKESLYHIKLGGSAQIEINENGSKTLPGDFKLITLYPNPFEKETTLKYLLNKSSWISYEIYNIKGERIFTSNKNVTFNLSNEIKLDFSKYPTGVYFCKISSASSTKVLKLLMMR